MSNKFLVVLLVSIFYNGVTYSSPVKETASDLKTNEKQVASPVAPDHINHSVEPSTPAPDNSTHLVNPTPAKNSTNLPQPDGKVNATVTDKKTITPATNATTVDTKNATTTLNSTTVNSTTVNSTPAAELKNTGDATPVKLTEMPRPLPAGQSTTPSTTTTPETSTKPPTTKPAAVTSTTAAPTSTEALLEHNSSSAQQKGFDGASFVGGIVLTIGLTAIGFIAFKYYKSGKIDGNYRTL